MRQTDRQRHREGLSSNLNKKFEVGNVEKVGFTLGECVNRRYRYCFAKPHLSKLEAHENMVVIQFMSFQAYGTKHDTYVIYTFKTMLLSL